MFYEFEQLEKLIFKSNKKCADVSTKRGMKSRELMYRKCASAFFHKAKQALRAGTSTSQLLAFSAYYLVLAESEA